MPPEECGYGGYSVKCTYRYDKKKEKYFLSMWMNREDIEDDFRIDAQEIDAQYIPGTIETIEENICRIVDYMCLSGRLEPYIQRYEYTYRCFDYGSSYYESRHLKNPEE